MSNFCFLDQNGNKFNVLSEPVKIRIKNISKSKYGFIHSYVKRNEFTLNIGDPTIEYDYILINPFLKEYTFSNNINFISGICGLVDISEVEPTFAEQILATIKKNSESKTEQFKRMYNNDIVPAITNQMIKHGLISYELNMINASEKIENGSMSEFVDYIKPELDNQGMDVRIKHSNVNVLIISIKEKYI